MTTYDNLEDNDHFTEINNIWYCTSCQSPLIGIEEFFIAEPQAPPNTQILGAYAHIYQNAIKYLCTKQCLDQFLQTPQSHNHEWSAVRAEIQRT